MLSVAVLGALTVTRDGRPLPVPSGKTSELVVRLALVAGETVRADRLVDELWADPEARARRNTLQSKVTMLRRAVGDPPLITSHDGGYALAVNPSDVDAVTALTATTTAAALFEAGDDAGAADLCGSTLLLYRGDVLPAAGDGDWVTPYRTRLEDARITLLEVGFGARLRLGEAGDLIGELEAAVVAYPFQETLWELLITAQYRAGRQADALASYRRLTAQLDSELGLQPRPQLQDLERRILVQDPAVDVPVRPAARRRAARRIGNLPSMAADLVGRDAEIAALCDLLDDKRLVEILGSGGIGKTAVAVAVGRALMVAPNHEPDGIWLARLESAVTADQVVDALVSAVDGPGDEAALLQSLKDASAVVILDNCEHVIGAAAAFAVRLLDAAPGLRILCTSQVPLGVEGEVVFELLPLNLPEAAELFDLRAQEQHRSRGSRPDTEVDAVLTLCRSLDGLPLAIELAAGRTRSLSVEEITRRLKDPFMVLADPTSRKPERRRSLRATIGWSYDLLFPDDQRGLWALATFSGGAPLPAVEAVLGALDVPLTAALDVVDRLASRSLVTVDDPGPAPTTGDGTPIGDHPVRYRLLDSIRTFALQAMTSAGLAAPAYAAHAAWFAEAAGSSTAGVRSARQAEQLAFARAERANIDAALAWGAAHDPTMALRTAIGFGWAWVVLGDSRGAARILAALERSGDGSPAPDRADALLLAAWIEASTGHLDRARLHIAAATELAEAINSAELRARSRYYLAYVVSHQGDFGTAMALTEHSRALYDALDRPWDQAANGLFAARAAISAGDVPRSVAAAEQAQRWLLEVEDPWLQVRGEAMLGELARLQHRFDHAVDRLARAAATSHELGFQQTEAYQVMSLGRAQCQAGDYDAGTATLELAIDKSRATGDVRLAALTHVHLGRVLRATGHTGRAREALQAAIAWHHDAGGGELAALGECLLAAMDATDGRPGAEQRLQGLLDRARVAGDAPVEVFALDALARVAAADGAVGTARTRLESADRRMPAASHVITALDRSDARWVRQVVAR